MSYLSVSFLSTLSSTKDALKSAVSNKLSYDPAALTLDQSSNFSEDLEGQESKTLISTRRTITLDNTTEIAVSQPLSTETTRWRFKWTGTGTAPGFRTARTLSTSALTVLSITRLSDTIVRITVDTAPFSTAAITIGDYLLLEQTTDTFTSPFNANNTGTPVKVVAKTSTTVDVLDTGFMVNDPSVTLGAVFAEAVKVFSANGVQINDVLISNSDNISYGNRGEFQVTAVSSDYVEVSADSLVIETVDTLLNNFYFADEVIRYLALLSNGSLQISLDGEILNVFQLFDQAFFASTVKCTEIILLNNSDTSLQVDGMWASTGFEAC